MAEAQATSHQVMKVQGCSAGCGPRLVDAIDAGLREAPDPERAAGERAYLKSNLEFIGVPVPRIRSIVRRASREHPLEQRTGLLDVAERLWMEPVHERRVAAVELLAHHVVLLAPQDLPFVERLLREARTWALVDPLADSVASAMVERWAELGRSLDRWSSDSDFWIRRAALLALRPALARGGGDWTRFAAYADAMLDEREFFIRKAIGWVLREVGKRRPQLVVGWLGARTHRASGVTVREAVKYVPEAQREALMAAYRSRQPLTKQS